MRSGLFVLLLSSIAAGSLPDAVRAQGPVSESDQTSLALIGATVWTATGEPPLEDAVIIVKDGFLECIGLPEECAAPSDLDTLAVHGHWIIPGLIDTHVHFSQTGWVDGRPDVLDLRFEFPYAEVVHALRSDSDLLFRSYLCAGVTTVFDAGGFPWTWDLRDRAAAGEVVAPRVLAAGPLLSTQDHWLNLPAELQFLHMADRDAVRAGAGYLASAGTDAIKVWYVDAPGAAAPQRHPEYLRLAGEWATRARLPLFVHATTLERAKDALRAGARTLVHSIEDRLVDEEFMELATGGSARYYVPTLTVHEGYREFHLREFREDRTEPACIDPGTLERVRSTVSLPGPPGASERAQFEATYAERRERMAENLLRVHSAGIPIALGTDAGNPHTLHGPAVFREMEAMQEAGLTPSEVLEAATRNAAAALGREIDAGTLERGKIADLVVLSEDPTADVRNVRSIELVVRRGRAFPRSELTFSGEQ